MARALAVVAVALAAVLVTAAPFAADTGRSRPPAALSDDEKTIWMTEWVACRHESLGRLARELNLKVTANRTVQATARFFARVAERPLYDDPHQYQLAVDGCRNGILWRFFHE
jgi:hypothetical protein